MLTWTLIAQIFILALLAIIFATAITLLVTFARSESRKGPDQAALRRHAQSETAPLRLPTTEQIKEEATVRYGAISSNRDRFSEGAHWAIDTLRDQAGTR